MTPPFARIAAMLLSAPATMSGKPGRRRLRTTATPTRSVLPTYRGGPAGPTWSETAGVNSTTWARNPATINGAHRIGISPRDPTRPPPASPIARPITIAYRMNIRRARRRSADARAGHSNGGDGASAGAGAGPTGDLSGI